MGERVASRSDESPAGYLDDKSMSEPTPAQPMILDCSDKDRFHGECWRPATPEDGNLEAAVKVVKEMFGVNVSTPQFIAREILVEWLGVSDG